MRWKIIGWLLSPVAVFAQFSSGSTGSDGALNLTTPGTVIFNPKSFMPPLDPAGDNIFNFTTINIGAGVTVKLSGAILTSPVLWLAQGAVTINGTIDLSGGAGYNEGPPSARMPSIPGAGGYSGGIGLSGASPAEPGNGPGGGIAGTSTCNIGGGGSFTGNSFLVPLIGGSGGGGASLYGGGAGGGAILIASSTSITVNGTINANGGGGFQNLGQNAGAGSGSGGAIRLAAPIVAGSGATLTAIGGNGGGGNCGNTRGGNGLVRIEAFQNTLGFSTGGTPLALASPFAVFPPPPPPSVSVTSVGGIAVPPNPTGSFTVPDVLLNSSSPLAFNIQASNIPLGTTVTLTILSENGPDQMMTSLGLTGTVQSSTTSVTATLPSGYSYGFVKATWTQ